MAQDLKRLQLQSLLEVVLGTRNVYFQPPENVQMRYPCIVYKRDSSFTNFADDKPYRYMKRYQVTVIDQDPDSRIPEKVAALPLSSFQRFFVVDNLNHDNFSLYF